MIDRYVIGGFYRVHTTRGKDENLNAPGMQFEPLAVRRLLHPARPRVEPGRASPNRFYTYGVVARLAALAAAIELEETAAAAEEEAGKRPPSPSPALPP